MLGVVSIWEETGEVCMQSKKKKTLYEILKELIKK